RQTLAEVTGVVIVPMRLSPGELEFAAQLEWRGLAECRPRRVPAFGERRALERPFGWLARHQVESADINGDLLMAASCGQPASRISLGAAMPCPGRAASQAELRFSAGAASCNGAANASIIDVQAPPPSKPSFRPSRDWQAISVDAQPPYSSAVRPALAPWLRAHRRLATCCGAPSRATILASHLQRNHENDNLPFLARRGRLARGRRERSARGRNAHEPDRNGGARDDP